MRPLPGNCISSRKDYATCSFRDMFSARSQDRECPKAFVDCRLHAFILSDLGIIAVTDPMRVKELEVMLRLHLCSSFFVHSNARSQLVSLDMAVGIGLSHMILES